MAKLEKFMEMMVQRKAQRAILISDQPFELFVQGRKIQGTTSSAAQLAQALEEITPGHLREQLSQSGFFKFRHTLSQGVFDIEVENFFDKLQVTIVLAIDAQPVLPVQVAKPSSSPSPAPQTVQNKPQQDSLPVQALDAAGTAAGCCALEGCLGCCFSFICVIASVIFAATAFAR